MYSYFGDTTLGSPRMANRFYDPGEQRSAKVRDLFAAIAPRYDLINDLQSFGLHRWWKRRSIQLASVRPGEHALDLCCGTGDLAFALARHGAQVVGLDFSAPMLAVAQARLREGPLATSASNQLQPATRNPQFLRGDALSLPFPDASFHIVTIGYGLRKAALTGRVFSADKVWIPSGAQGREQIERSRQKWQVARFDLLQVHNLLNWQDHLPTLLAMKASVRFWTLFL